MELSLKVELSDEQYEQLMKNSYDEIFKSDVMINALRDVIIDSFVKYFDTDEFNKNKNNVYGVSYPQSKHLIEQCLFDKRLKRRSTWGNDEYEEIPSDLLKQLVLEGSEHQMAAFRNKVRLLVSELLSDKQYISSLINSLFINSIRAGLAMGTEQMMFAEENRQHMLGMITYKMDAVESKLYNNN